jgi:hypothetical protein
MLDQHCGPGSQQQAHRAQTRSNLVTLCSLAVRCSWRGFVLLGSWLRCRSCGGITRPLKQAVNEGGTRVWRTTGVRRAGTILPPLPELAAHKVNLVNRCTL